MKLNEIGYNEISDRFCTYALLPQKNTAAVAHMHFFEENSIQLKVRKYTNAFYSKKNQASPKTNALLAIK
jgi:hypothetical protein